ncbi:MAG: triose-phosphate isomerase [Legionellaceae bacterium]|nr:triose-phosphate isomerase [Legionellaceae bacterium]
MRKKIIAANWKMHGNLEWVRTYCHQFLSGFHSETVQAIFFPPAIYVPELVHAMADKPIAIGAQNVYVQDEGAFTGEHSARMFQEFGCRYVLVGHSERRQCFHENEKIIADKFHHVKERDMIPVLCVGETEEQRQKGDSQAVIRQQLFSAVHGDRHAFSRCIIAYEPVWAIGTGKTASPEQAQEMHAFIRQQVAELAADDAQKLAIVYGGSVNAANARDLLNMPDIDGGLVGGASLQAQQLLEIIECIS